MKKTTSLFLILWVLIIMSSISTKGQNILVLQLPDPCFNLGTTQHPLQVSQPFQLAVNPNPAKDELTLTVSHKETMGLIKIRITDIRGVTLSDEQYFSSHQKWINTINVSHLPKGVYIISAHRNGQMVSQKIIKQ